MNAYAHPQFDLMRLPPQRECTSRHVRATAAVVGGIMDTAPQWRGMQFSNAIHMPLADVLVTATYCGRPLLLPEMRSLARHSGLDGLIARDRPDNSPTFDIYLAARDEWLLCYLLWIDGPDERWLVPSAGSTESIRVSPLGLEPSSGRPYVDRDAQLRGFELAARTYRCTLGRM